MRPQSGEEELDRRSLLSVVLGDGRPPLLVAAGGVAFAGCFAIFLGATRQFLPHDAAYLGESAAELCRVANCRIVEFMVHDRVAWGSTLIAAATMQVWLVAFPLSKGRSWAWWVLVVTTVFGFGSFLAYLGYGYLDTWHGLGTVLLVPVYVWGVYRTRSLVAADQPGLRTLLRTAPAWRRDGGPRLGRELILLVAVGLVVAGLVIVTIGGSVVFVPQDLQFLGLQVADLNSLNRRLVPLIAHDRAGFGGGVLTGGVLIGGCVWFADRQTALWHAIGIGSVSAFGGTLTVHAAVGYLDVFHLAPAFAAAGLLTVGVVVGRREVGPPSDG